MIEIKKKLLNIKKKGKEIWNDHSYEIAFGCGFVGMILATHIIDKLRGIGSYSFEAGRKIDKNGNLGDYWIRTINYDSFGVPYKSSMFEGSMDDMRGILKSFETFLDNPEKYFGKMIKF